MRVFRRIMLGGGTSLGVFEYSASEEMDLSKCAFGADVIEHNFNITTGKVICSGEITSLVLPWDFLNSAIIPKTVIEIGVSVSSPTLHLSRLYIEDIESYLYINFDSLVSPFHNTEFYIGNDILSQLIIPDKITEIKKYAFCGCNSLTSVSLSNVHIVGDLAFDDCPNLSTILLADAPLTYLGLQCFPTTIENPIVVPTTCTFEYCAPFGYANFHGIKIIFEKDVLFTNTDEFPPETLGNCEIKGALYLNGSMPSSVNSGKKAPFDKSIFNKVFVGCGVQRITEYAFSSSTINELHIDNLEAWCTILITGNTFAITKNAQKIFIENEEVTDTIIIPENVDTIGRGAFSNFTSLKAIAIPDSVTSIKDYAFYNCTSAQYYDFSTHTAVPTLGSYVFSNIPTDCKIIVPDDLYDSWIAATNWAKSASRIIKKSDWDASQVTE